jgi:acyl-homoserine lactone acylase PvdQ
MNGFLPRWSRRLTIHVAATTFAASWLVLGCGQMRARSGDLSLATVTRADDQSCTPLTVEGDEVNICRDDFGVPHIFAETNKGLFQGYGYAIAQDRLWQLELFRRAAKGRLAEILGANDLATNLATDPPLTALAADTDIRTRHYTDAELQDQYALLDPEEAQIFGAYADGINRYLTEVVAADPANKLPFEFHDLGIGVPDSWTALDVVANAVYQSRFGQVGGMERRNQTLLNNLITKHGQSTGLAIFNDVYWIDDPDTPVSVPAEGAMGKRPGFRRAHQSYGVGQDNRDIRGQQRHIRGDAMRWGTGYLFNGVCTPFEQRVEVINVKGASPVTLTLRRTIHGPVVATGIGVVFSQKGVVWKREIESMRALLAMNRATNLQEFETAVRRSDITWNVL